MSRRMFAYNWGELLTPLVALPLIGALLWWRGENLSSAEPFVFGGIFLVLLVRQGWPLCRVVLTESEVEIRFLLPFWKNGRLRLEEIEGYSEIAIEFRGKKRLIGGFLKPVGNEPIMLAHAGTKDFEALNAALCELFPNIDGAAGDAGSD